MLQKGAAFLKHPHLALPLGGQGCDTPAPRKRVFCGVHAANSVRLKKQCRTSDSARFFFTFFLDFSAARRVCRRCSTRSATEPAADAVVKVVALEVEIRGVVVLIADGLDDFLEGARLHDLAEGVDVLDALARDVLDAQTAAVVRHQPALAAELLDGEADGNTAHAVFYGELALGEQGAGLVFGVENLALQLLIDADGDGLLTVLFVIIGGAGDGTWAVPPEKIR